MQIADIVSIIDSMLLNEEKWGLPHGCAEALVGPRTFGSTTRHGLEVIPSDTDLTEIGIAEAVRRDGCSYLRFCAPELEGAVGAIPIWFAKQHQWFIGYRIGDHGYELHLEAGGPDYVESDEITIVLREQEEHQIVVDWYPGEPLANIPEKWDGNIHDLSEFTAVSIK